MTEPVPWQQLTHAEIYAAVHAGPGPGVSQPAEDAWAQIEEVVRFAERHLSAAISRSAGSWEGSTAEAARSGFTALNSWALDAAGDAQLTVAAVRAQAEQVLHVRNEMPPAMTPEQLLEADAAAGREPDNPTAQQNLAASHGAEPRARDLMAGYGANTLVNARKLDYWTVPPTITVEVAGPAGAGTGTPVAGGPGAGGPAVGGAGAGGPAAAGAGAGPGPVSGPGPAGGTGAGGGAGGLPLGGAGGLPVGGAVGLPGGVVAGGVPAGGAAGPAGRAGPGVSAAGTGPGPGSGVTPGPGGAGSPGSAAGGPGPGGLAAGRPGAGGRGTGGTGGVGPGGGRPGAAAGGRPTVPPVRTFPPGSPAGALPPGAGGRGVRPPEAGPPAPRSSGTPAPTWRDLVQREAARAGEPPATRPAEPGGARPAADPRTAVAGRAPDPARTGTAHGLYPPMAGTAGPQGGERRRPAYLVDDSGVFDVTVDCAEPVIRGTVPPA